MTKNTNKMPLFERTVDTIVTDNSVVIAALNERVAELEKALTLTNNELSGAIDEINSISSDLDEDPWDKETCHNNQVLLKAGN